MAQLWGRPEIKLKMGLELSEEEARALLLISEYGVETLLKIFYTHMEEKLVDKHKKGIISLFDTVKQPLSLWVSKVDNARKVFDNELL